MHGLTRIRIPWPICQAIISKPQQHSQQHDEYSATQMKTNQRFTYEYIYIYDIQDATKTLK